MVNPPKDETVRIRKMLEQFGAVGDANVFYCNSDSYFLGTQSQVPSFYHGVSSLASSGSSSLGGIDMENLFTMPSQMGFNEADHHHQYVSNVASNLCPTDQNSNFQFQQGGTITVFINGVPTEVPRGPINTKAMFDEDLVLLHSSGDPLPTDEFGFLMYSLQHGDAYFLVPRQT
ncbi:PREDICTED: WUSCHEL-related homeobox 11-like [Tarenaya hassleriana]|uniref:WUSCHEL-related homeobox 11-like n=1 Tax=Tarenaya hassleriana TaxID=28532 RepID=UPI0008FD338D|nr:PREDICTED: WUSCHEL-related homeobox 11-like [Tarenaya hassleriana]